MDIWTLIRNDHQNITALGYTILRALDRGVVRNRERLVSELADELEAHFEAEEDSVYEALAGKEGVADLLASLQEEQERIEEEIGRLASSKRKNTADWTSRFEDFTYLVDTHFHREEHELIPRAQELLTGDAIAGLAHAYIEEKAEEIRERRPRSRIVPAAIWAGAALAAVAGLAVAAERTGYLRRWREAYPRLGSDAYASVKSRSRENRARREKDGSQA
jgi:hemerythrin-like domain-containing protein